MSAGVLESLERRVAAQNQAAHRRAGRLGWAGPLAEVLGRWASPVPGDAEGGARWLQRALDAWAEFVAWAKWWERTLPPFSWPVISSAPTALSGGRRARLTVLLITKNEEAKLPRCLDSVRWADEVVVVDGQSTDRTRELAQAFGATVVNRPFSGSFAEERNAGLDAARGDWVLQMDADELVSPELRAAIERVLREGSPHAALKIRRRNYFLGRRMRYGGWYHYNLVLFRRPLARYEGLVHERLQVQGSVGTLEGDLLHVPFQSLAQFIDRQNRYTTLQARELLQRPDRPDAAMIARQLRRRPVKLWWKLYVKKQGFRDGLWGLVFSVLFAWVDWLIWAKCWEATYAQER